jgi:hypothetical protein
VSIRDVPGTVLPDTMQMVLDCILLDIGWENGNQILDNNQILDTNMKILMCFISLYNTVRILNTCGIGISELIYSRQQ